MVANECLGQQEFSGCDFQDKRLSERCVHIAESFFARPGSIVWSAFRTNKERKAAYHFFQSPKVTVSKIQLPHFTKTLEDVRDIPLDVLMIHDTTYCSFKNGKAFEKSEGYLSKTTQGKNLQGFAVHSSLALTAQGVPIGLAAQSIYQHFAKEEEHDELPIEEKESNRWLEGMRVADGAMLRQDHIVHISDREGDIFECLSCAYQEKRRFIIRQSSDRRTGEVYSKSQGLLTKRLAALDWSFKCEVNIYDSKTSKYVKRTFGIKGMKMTFPVPPGKRFSKEAALKKPFEVNVLEVRSIDEFPEIKWILLTNLPIDTEEEMYKIVKYYQYRWHIENYHKVLKSGFQVEDARLETFEGIRKLISMLSIHLSRVEGDKSCEVVLQRHEWEALCIHHKIIKFEEREHASPPTLKEAVTYIAQLGGYMNRKKDLPPGIIVIWRGWLRLAEMANYHQIIAK